MKNATLRQLAVFEAVARHLHFTRAAAALGTTQPSVSIQIKQLEDNVGLDLFEQVGKRVQLTEAGRALYQHCREISRQLAEAKIVLERLKGIAGGQLRLAIAPAAKYFVPGMLAGFVRQHPGVVIDLHVAAREPLLAELEAGERDMAILTHPDDGFAAQPILHDPLVAIAATDHPLTAARNVSLTRLAQEPFVLREPGSQTRQVIEQRFTRRSLQIKPVMVINSNEGIKQAVAAGLGVAIVPQHSALPEQSSGRLAVLDVAELNLQSTWYLAHRQDKRFSPVAEAFRDFMLQHAEADAAGSAALSA